MGGTAYWNEGLFLGNLLDWDDKANNREEHFRSYGPFSMPGPQKMPLLGDRWGPVVIRV